MNSYEPPEERLETYYKNDALVKLLQNKKYNIVRYTREYNPDDYVYEEQCYYGIINPNTGNAIGVEYYRNHDYSDDSGYSEEFFGFYFYMDVFENIKSWKQFQEDDKTMVSFKEGRNKFLHGEFLDQKFTGNEISYNEMVSYLDNEH